MPKYKTTVISGPDFKGLSQSLALTSGNPRFALDCVNVLPSVGGLAKLRVPTTVSTANISAGPDQFGEWEGASTKQLLAFVGSSIYTYSLDDFTPELIDTQADYAGPVPWNVIRSNNIAFLQNGLSTPLKYTGIPIIPGDDSSALQFWGIQQAATPTLGAAVAGSLNLTDGRRYRVAYKNGNTLAVGTASDESASTGALVNQDQPVTIPAEIHGADGQITQARLYATLDGGADYFFHSQITGPFPQTITDSTPDEDLDQSERAPLINNQPPVAKFMCLWGSRIFMFNLPEENSKWVAYTGYNRIFVGRPEETCPPGNRIKLETGADDIAGGGVIAAGVIAFDKSNKMFMFRGQPEDITVDAPVEFSLFLQQLPWDIGCASHYTICSTKRGLVWLSPSLDVFVFDGSSQPLSIDEGAEPLLRTINQSVIGNSRAVYWQQKGRDWYILAIPTGTSNNLNKLLIFDLEPAQEKNFGIVPLDIGEFQSIGIVEMMDGTQKLVVGQGGALKEVKITPTTINGIEESISATADTLGAFWKSGYIGNESPEVEKFFRWGRVTADQSGIRIKRWIIRDQVTQPMPIEFVDTGIGGKLATNKKARRMAYELRFRDEDVSQNILSLEDVYIPVAIR